MQKWLKEVNPWALDRMINTLLEADQRGMWNAKEDTIEELKKMMLEIEGELEED